MAAEKEFSDEQVMFTLAMLAYLGTQNLNVGPLNDFLLRIALDEALGRVEPVRGRWEVVWGPVTYAAPLTLFADSAVFVVRDLTRPARVCVVIRGTNPYSAFDWIYGDLWTDRVLPWRFGDLSAAPGAAISLSSALGLSTIKNMRWFELPTLGLRQLADTVRRGVLVPAEWVVKQLIAPLGSTVSGLLGGVRGELSRDLAALRAERDTLEKDFEGRLGGLAQARESPAFRRTRTRVDRALRDAAGAVEIDLFHLMEGVQRTRSALHPGKGLESFLASEVQRAADRDAGPLEVFVTGHSKAGALAPVVAQWLSDTRHTRHGGWNPELDATLHCFAYAGPTPGNRAFSRLYDETLGSRGHRFSNRNDMVPHAWAVPSRHFETELDLLQVPDLYRSALDMSPSAHKLLKEVATRLADEVRPLDYAHTGGHARVFDGKVDQKSDDFFTHVLNQHTTAYVKEFGLEPYLEMKDLFTLL